MEKTNSNLSQIDDHKHWNNETAFQVWSHFAKIGGADKDRMIQIATLLLGFSAGIVAFTFSEVVKSNKIEEPLVAILLSIVGIIIAGISGIMTLLYGGYANWNWAKADQIAKDYDWSRLDPKDLPPQLEDTTKKLSFVGWALKHSRPKLLHEKLAPIFYWFLGVSFLSFCVHLFILVWGFMSLDCK